MESNLEEKRSLHEERDRIELAIVNEILSKKSSHREKLDSEHRQKALIDRYMKCSKTLLNLYEQPGAVAPSETKNNPFNEYYLNLKQIRDFYSNHATEPAVTLAYEFEEIEAARQFALGIKTKPQAESQHQSKKIRLDDEDSIGDSDFDGPDQQSEIQRLAQGLPTTDLVEFADAPTVPAQPQTRSERLVEFTDEEGYGRYLDLTKCHEAFLQTIKRDESKPNYLTFLDNFDQFAAIERDRKLTVAYKNYVEMMLEYFRDYSKRAKPLFDFKSTENSIHEKFVELWNNKKVPGWFHESDRSKTDLTPMIEVESYRSPEDLMELGLDCLKNELQSRGLKCGGTLEERAKRLWAIRGKSDHQIDPNLKAANVINKKGKKRTTIDPFVIASTEAKLSMYAEFFADHRLATIENVQRKQARTAEERNESDEEISDADDDENEQSDVVYNPKNLPLCWDGKPIPYWLYKLHGLNITFTCEICGNATYKGPKTFQRHFAEWRHAHGMRCLGIPNTAHFANITKIQDAISLWDKLRNERQKDKFQPSNEEEYEDSQGNVVNKKTYEDLKRQGLL